MFKNTTCKGPFSFESLKYYLNLSGYFEHMDFFSLFVPGLIARMVSYGQRQAMLCGYYAIQRVCCNYIHYIQAHSFKKNNQFNL